MSKIDAVIFDLDGVLIDATEWHYEALNRALSMFGYCITRYAHLATYNGLPTRKKLQMLTVEKGLPEALHSLINSIKQVYTREEVLAHCWPAFEKQYLVSRLKRDGYRLAVCSNAIHDSVELMIRRSGLYEYFDFLISNEEVSRPKPDPEIYHLAFERFGITPDQSVIVEDSPHGLEAARRAGAWVCQVAGFHEVTYDRVKGFVSRVEQEKEAASAIFAGNRPVAGGI